MLFCNSISQYYCIFAKPFNKCILGDMFQKQELRKKTKPKTLNLNRDLIWK